MNGEERDKIKQYKGVMKFIEDNSPAFIAAILDSVLFSHACDLVDPHDRALPDPAAAKRELYILRGLRDVMKTVENE